MLPVHCIAMPDIQEVGEPATQQGKEGHEATDSQEHCATNRAISRTSYSRRRVTPDPGKKPVSAKRTDEQGCEEKA